MGVVILILGWLKKFLKYFITQKFMAVMDEIGKFDVKANVVPNVLEKYMAFIFDSNFFWYPAIYKLYSRYFG